MITRFTLPPHALTRLDEHGVDSEAVLSEARLSADLIREERILLTTEQLFAFWHAVGEVSGDPLIGLKLGREEPLERLDVVSLAALSAPTFREAISRAARYKQLMCPEEIRVETTGSESAVRFVFPLAGGVESRVLIDLCFTWITLLARRGSGGAIRAKRVELNRSPTELEQYAAHFDCPIRFDAAASRVVFVASDLDRPFVTRNADLLRMLAPQLDAELASRHDDDLRNQVKAVVRRLLAGSTPDLRDVARELASSPRTLQRRLGDLGVTYRQVLDEARLDLARHYLRHSSMELSEVAYLLGYEDANSFFRAFHRWVGVPPGQWRATADLTVDS